MSSVLFKQFIKFGMVGLLNTMLAYIINNGCYYLLNLNEQISNIIAFIITVFISYILNNKYVFNSNRNKSFLKGLLKVYMSYFITGILITGILLYYEVRVLLIPNYIASLLNLIITVPLNFILNKFWAFKEKYDRIKK